MACEHQAVNMRLGKETEHCLGDRESREVGSEVCEALDYVGYHVVVGAHYSFLLECVK